VGSFISSRCRAPTPAGGEVEDFAVAAAQLARHRFVVLARAGAFG
jgi:hypothetical protein